MLEQFSFTDEDILLMENILLGENKHFDRDEKIPIIKCMDESISVMACPGSGKTTALLAKIIMILKFLPMENNKGICIITHTNVAINEIKSKLGAKSDILFQYPNFVGTIHSFIDKFLAIPYMKLKYNGNITSIDDNYYFAKMAQESSLIIKLGISFYGTLKSEIDKHPELQNKIKRDYIKSIEMKYVDGTFQFFKGHQAIAKDMKKPRYILLHELFVDKLFSQGILKYSDTYLLAQMYLKEHTIITEYFANRFRYVFMDEIQDNSNIQNEIISKVFQSERIIIQKYGDLNQTIYNDDENRQEKQKDGNCRKYEISKSMRYTQNIADFINNLRVENCQKNLIGRDCEFQIIPHILIYNGGSISKVKEKYVELINQYKLNNNDNIFKSCGWVGYKEKSDQLSIQSYFEEYVSSKNHNIKFKGYSFCGILRENIKSGNSVASVYKSAIEFCIKYLNLVEFKLNGIRISKTRLSNLLYEEYSQALNEYRKQIAIFARFVLEFEDNALQAIGNATYQLLQNIITIDKKDVFLKLFENQNGVEQVSSSISNKYIKDDVIVNIDTVHGVKGETHTATLYLETYYNKHTDMQRVLKFLVNEAEDITSNDEKKAMKIAYVGMSRATDLLCVAIKKDFHEALLPNLEQMKKSGKIEIVYV